MNKNTIMKYENPLAVALTATMFSSPFVALYLSDNPVLKWIAATIGIISMFMLVLIAQSKLEEK